VLASEELTIGGRGYRLTQLQAGRARRILFRLFKTCGPALAMLAGKEGGLAALKGDGLADAAKRLALDLSEDEFESIVTDLLFTGHVEERQDNGGLLHLTKELADLKFAGRLDDFFKLIGAMLRFNFGNFLGGLESMAASLGGAGAAKVPASSQ